MINKSISTRVQAPTPKSDVGDASSGYQPRIDDVPHETHAEPCETNVQINKADYFKNGLAKCRNKVTIGFLNVRTIQMEFKRLELTHLFNATKQTILGIADHKIVSEDEEIRTQYLNDCALITSSAWRNSNGAASGGVGLVINKKIEHLLTEVTSINQRILIAHFSGNPITTVIVHYSPIEGSVEATDHYITLSNTIHSVPKHNLLMVLGDFNAHIGNDMVKYSYHQNTNSNGKLLLEMAIETGMIITNTSFQKKKGKLFTYVSDMNDCKSQIDFILINKKWRNSLKNIEAYNSFASLGSDHRILSAKVQLSLRATKKAPKVKPLDWGTLANDSDLQDLYTITVTNRYEQLCQSTEANEVDVTRKYGYLIEANKKTAEELIPSKKRSKRAATAKDPRVVTAREVVNQAFTDYISTPTPDNELILQEKKGKLKLAYDEVMADELDSMVKKVEKADIRAQHAESWKLINQISGRNSSKIGKIKGKGPRQRVESWYKHFSQLLGSEPDSETDSNLLEIEEVLKQEDLNISTGPFTLKEYQEVKKSLNTNKAAGEDGITAEVLKYCDLDSIVLSYANDLLMTQSKPEQWSIINLVPVPKTGDLSLCTNYRGIALTSIVAKLVNRLLLNRIQPKLDCHLRPNQNGFRPGRSTTAHILALRRMIEGVKRKNLKAVLLFVDFSKAFDSVHRGKMMLILKSYGIPPELVTAIARLYENTKAKVLSPDGESDLFDIICGVLQGDTLAPYLFTIIIDYVMRQTIGDKAEQLGFTLQQRRSRRVAPTTETDLCFADDIVLLSNELHQARELLKRLEAEASKVGLNVNAKKTHLMAFNQDKEELIYAKSGQLISEVDNFKYLGGWLKSAENDINIRIALAWSSCHKLNKIWKSSLNRSIKVRLFVATVESVLLYNSETWTLTKQLEKRLNGTYTRMLRMALNISWQQHMTNEQLYLNLPRITDKISSRRLRLAGHVMRNGAEIANKFLLWNPIHGKPSRGRKHKTFIDVLLQDTELEDINDVRNAMMDKTWWKQIVYSTRSGDR